MNAAGVAAEFVHSVSTPLPPMSDRPELTKLTARCVAQSAATRQRRRRRRRCLFVAV